jgi:hypothetical protein
LLATCEIADVDPTLTKRHRLYNAFAQDQNQRQDRTRILGFVRHSMKPERFARFPERFEPMRAHLNRALAFAGLAVDAIEWCGSLPDAGNSKWSAGNLHTVRRPALLFARVLIHRACCIRLPQSPLTIP